MGSKLHSWLAAAWAVALIVFLGVLVWVVVHSAHQSKPIATPGVTPKPAAKVLTAETHKVKTRALSKDTQSTHQVTVETFVHGSLTQRKVSVDTHQESSVGASHEDIYAIPTTQVIENPVMPQAVAGSTPGSIVSLGLAFTPKGLGPLVTFRVAQAGPLRASVGITQVGISPGVGVFLSSQVLPSVDLGVGPVLFIGSPSPVSLPLGPVNISPAVSLTYRF